MKLTQIRDLRALKVDRLTARAIDLRRALVAAQRNAANMIERYRALCASEPEMIDRLLDQTLRITEPAARLAAMNHAVNRVRDVRAQAYREMSAAEAAVMGIEQDIKETSSALAEAQAHLEGIERACQEAGRKGRARAEDIEDDNVLETFAGLRGTTAWA
ncbi:MAG: hypothetical protein AAF647_10605 [Pseudomonadota bacterium]